MDLSHLSEDNMRGYCDFPKRIYDDNGYNFTLEPNINYETNLGFKYKQLANETSLNWLYPGLIEIQKKQAQQEKELEEKTKKTFERFHQSMKSPIQRLLDEQKKMDDLMNPLKGYQDLVRVSTIESITKKVASHGLIDKSIGVNNDPTRLATARLMLKDPTVQLAFQQLNNPISELSQGLKTAQSIDPAIYKLATEQWRERENDNEYEIIQNLHIPPPINKNQALEDKLDSQIRETKLLREELKQSKEKNLVKNIITREPNVIRPSKFAPPKSQNDASEFATECVYWYEEEHNQLPTQKELWRLIKTIATDNDVSIQGFLVEIVDRTTVRIEEKKWTKEQCRKFFNEYLK